MEDLLLQTCKKLHFSSSLVANAKKIKAKNHLDFLLKLFTAELEERDIKRRNAYLKAAKFDIIKTFEDYTFEDIKFPAALSPDDILGTTFIPRRENLILYGNVGAGKTHLAARRSRLWCWFQNPVLANSGTCQRSYRSQKARCPLPIYEAV